MNFLPVLLPKDIDKYFFNRHEDIKRINAYISMLEKDIPNLILITGYRGVGKTFLLKKVLKDQDNKFLTTYIDLSSILASEKGKLTEEEVLKEFLNKINNAVIEKQRTYEEIKTKFSNFFKELKLKKYDFNKSNINISDIPLPVIRDNYTKLSKFVMELPQKIVDSQDDLKGFIIVIDEFQLLKTMENPSAFFWLIRSYSQIQHNVCFIFTGSVSNESSIINMINGPDGAFGGRLIQLNIEPFSKEQTLKYINEKANNISFTDEGFERFYACTRGIPSYINSLASILPNNKICDENIIKEAFNLNIDQVVIMWLFVWGNLSIIEKEILITIVESDEKVNWKYLTKKLDYSTTTLSKYLDSLNNKGIIKYYVNEYVLSDIMLERWLKIKYENEGKYPLF